MTEPLLILCLVLVIALHFRSAEKWQNERERLYDRIQGPEASQWFQSIWAQKERQLKEQARREEKPRETVEVDLGL